MSKRPKIKPILKPTDKWLEIVAWASLIFLWFWTFWNYTNLPETIPTHFNASGEPDAYGSKNTIFTLPIIASLLFLLLSVISRFPYKYNYPIKITSENATAQYANTARMMRVLKLSIMLVFLLINILTIRTATGEAEGLGWWFMLVVLGLIVGPMVYFLNRSYRLEK
ncbi:MAG TPA: DUF1648 domain-containing protein [Flavobacteriaceae bacterium]|nr:DUF1648 domain-containing protein [Flavobacteriaceae bacterium]